MRRCVEVCHECMGPYFLWILIITYLSFMMIKPKTYDNAEMNPNVFVFATYNQFKVLQFIVKCQLSR